MKGYIKKEPLLRELNRIKTFYAGDRDKYINMIIDYVQNDGKNEIESENDERRVNERVYT